MFCNLYSDPWLKKSKQKAKAKAKVKKEKKKKEMKQKKDKKKKMDEDDEFTSAMAAAGLLKGSNTNGDTTASSASMYPVVYLTYEYG